MVAFVFRGTIHEYVTENTGILLAGYNEYTGDYIREAWDTLQEELVRSNIQLMKYRSVYNNPNQFPCLFRYNLITTNETKRSELAGQLFSCGNMEF